MRMACQPVPPSRRMVASSPRRSAVAIAAVLMSDSAAKAIDRPMISHTPQAPLVPSVRTLSRYSARVSSCVPGMGRGVRRVSERRAARRRRTPPRRRPPPRGAGPARGRGPRGRARRRGHRSPRRAATPRWCPRAGRAGRRRPSRAPSAATALLTATAVPWTSRTSPWRTARSSVLAASAPSGRRPPTGRPSPSGPCRAGTPASGSCPVGRVDARQAGRAAPRCPRAAARRRCRPRRGRR